MTRTSGRWEVGKKGEGGKGSELGSSWGTLLFTGSSIRTASETKDPLGGRAHYGVRSGDFLCTNFWGSGGVPKRETDRLGEN